jgi:hypothetical protein
MRRQSVRLAALAVLVVVFAVSFGMAFQEAQAWDSECHEPFCIEFCYCQWEYQVGVWRNGECLLNICETCDGPGVPCR